MATEQSQFKVYLPESERVEFKRIVEAEGKTVTGALRVMIRDYIAAAKAAA